MTSPACITEKLKRMYSLNTIFLVMAVFYIGNLTVATANKIMTGIQACPDNSVAVYDECERKCICQDGKLTTCYRIRKDFTVMNLEERARFIRALKAVSTLRPYRSYYEKLTKIHTVHFQRIHTLSHFFPFHRWYILKLENLLRKIDCRVTVPYWDWSKAVSSNSLWRNTEKHDIWYPAEHGLGGNGTGPDYCVQEGPFRKSAWNMVSWMKKCPCLSRKFVKKPRLENENYIRRIFQFPQTKFRCFEYIVRRRLHGHFHNAVGGTMDLTASSTAPEFWLHHGFMDKLWSDWQNRGRRFKFQYFLSVREKIPGSQEYGWQYMNLNNQPQSVKVLYHQSDSIYNITVSKQAKNQGAEDLAMFEDTSLEENSLSENAISKCDFLHMSDLVRIRDFLVRDKADTERFCLGHKLT